MIGWLMKLLTPAWAVLIHSLPRPHAGRIAGSLQTPAMLAMVEQSLRGKVVSRGFVLLFGAVLILATKGLAMKTWSVRGGAAVLAVVVFFNGVRAEELGFPESCIELKSVPKRAMISNALSTRDSVLFGLDRPNRKLNPGEQVPFIAWDTQTGKWLAKLQAPDPLVGLWKFSPDGTLLAIPLLTNTRIVQLWEVGPKDKQGVPALRQLTTLRQQYRRPTLSNARAEGHASFGDLVCLAWTPDSKTLLVSLKAPKYEIQFWSYTDKPSIWPDDSDRDSKWRPWAKVEVETEWDPGVAVSPDNQSLAIIANPGKGPINGQIVDLATAKLREKFQIRQREKPSYELTTDFRLQYSSDSKTLAISANQYLALWDTTPLAQRVAMEIPELSSTANNADSVMARLAFIQDNRILLTVKSATPEESRRVKGGQLQFRDALTAELLKEVSFPEELGSFQTIETLSDGRIMTKFVPSRMSHDSNARVFLWRGEDLLRYATEHASASTPQQKAD